MTEELFLISDVAKRLDVPPHRVAYLFLTRKLAEPKLRLGNRRVFTSGDAKRVAKALGRNWETERKEDHE
jgi:DNA-binding transcriptional MerR regulator